MTPARMLLVAALLASDWSSFRGPNGSGIAETTGLPAELGPDRNVLWKTPVPPGASSPVLTRESIFLTGHESGRLATLRLDRATGSVSWRRALERPRTEALHRLNHAASPTPVTDGGNVYAFFGDFGLVSYGPDGTERWRKALGPFSNLHGMAASPILAGGLLVQVCDQDRDSFILALRKDTGEVAWRAPRPEVVHGFATPTVFRPGGGAPQLVVPGSYLLTGYDLATGEKLWWVRGLTWQVKASAVAAGDTIFATGWAPGADAGERAELPPFEEVAAGADADRDGRLSPDEVPPRLRHSGSWNAIDLDRNGRLDAREWSFYRARRSSANVTLAVRPGNARGDLTDSHVLWRLERAVPEVPSPLLYDGVLYTIKSGGILASIDPATGSIVRQARLEGAIDDYYASPVAAAGRIYLTSEKGRLAVVRAGAQWEVVSVSDFHEPCYATPAIADARMYVRTATTLYCFGMKEQVTK